MKKCCYAEVKTIHLVSILVFFGFIMIYNSHAIEDYLLKDEVDIKNIDVDNLKLEDPNPEDYEPGRFVKDAKIPSFLKGWSDNNKIFVPGRPKKMKMNFFEEVVSHPMTCSSLKEKIEDSRIYSEKWKICYEDKSKKHSMDLFYNKEKKKWYIDFSKKKLECEIFEEKLKLDGIKGVHDVYSGLYCTQEAAFNQLKKGDSILEIAFHISIDSYNDWYAFFYFRKNEGKISYLGGFYCDTMFFASS